MNSYVKSFASKNPGQQALIPKISAASTKMMDIQTAMASAIFLRVTEFKKPSMMVKVNVSKQVIVTEQYLAELIKSGDVMPGLHNQLH